MGDSKTMVREEVDNRDNKNEDRHNKEDINRGSSTWIKKLIRKSQTQMH